MSVNNYILDLLNIKDTNIYIKQKIQNKIIKNKKEIRTKTADTVIG